MRWHEKQGGANICVFAPFCLEACDLAFGLFSGTIMGWRGDGFFVFVIACS
jgi:hypothetical protein